MNKLGFSEEEVENMTFHKWDAIFNAYKETWNFEHTPGSRYETERKKVSLLDI